MKKTIALLMMTCILLLISNVQSSAQKQDIERVLRNVAGNIIENTSFKIVNTETGETYTDSENLPIEKKYRVESDYNKWNYWNGVMNIGLIALGNQLNDQTYLDYVKRNVDFVFDHDSFFSKQYEKGLATYDMMQKYRMEMLDDCGAMGAGVLAVQQIDPQTRYRNYLDKAANYIMTKEYRLEDGVFCRTGPYEMTIWGDDLYMSVPFLARMGELTGDQKYFDEAAKQVVLFNKYLWDPQERIFFHCWYNDIKQNGVAHWGRCNGWIIVAQVELLDKLPEDHPMRDKLIELLTRQIVGLSRYQSNSGLWHQLIDKESTYLETSSTAMYTYAIAKAINEGWLDSRYAVIAERGWEGVTSKILADGQVEGICMGTGISAATHYYINRPTPTNDIHGLGAVILAGCEMMKLKNNK